MITTAATYIEFLDLLLQLCDQALFVFQLAVQVVDLLFLPVNQRPFDVFNTYAGHVHSWTRSTNVVDALRLSSQLFVVILLTGVALVTSLS